MPTPLVAVPSIKYESANSFDITNRNTVFEVAGGPVRRTCICYFDKIDRINSFLMPEYPVIELNKNSSNLLVSS